MEEHATFKGRAVAYEAIYQYCENADEYYMDEQQLQENDIRLKDAYRKAEGLLTSYEISDIRHKYGITQSDLCVLLGWGGKTITRYESHQVQDKAHDTILKKLGEDPEWFLALLEETKGILMPETYKKYRERAISLYEADQDLYLRKAIEAHYVKYKENQILQGNAELSLDKVVDVIRYFAASPKVTGLYKVKLMKLMWYADALAFKARGSAITGLAYQALPMGAVPIGHNSIIDLKGVPCEEEEMGEGIAYHFTLNGAKRFPSLSKDDIQLLDAVAEKLGKKTTDEIVVFMHQEKAYRETALKDIISFGYAESLRI